MLEQTCSHFASREVLFDGQNRVTYGALFEQVKVMASALQQSDIGVGDKVGVSLPNWYEFVVISLAVGSIGATLVPFNTRYRQDEVAYILSNSGAKMVFISEQVDDVSNYDMFTAVKGYIPTLKRIIPVRFEVDSLESYDDFLVKGKNQAPNFPTLEPSDTVYAILYTSGTTGEPKGAMLTHSNVLFTSTMSGKALRCTEQDVLLVPVPLFHVFGLVISLLFSIRFGMKMVLMERYKAEQALQLIEAEKVTIHHGVPTNFILELNHPNRKNYDLSSLRTGIIAAAPCPIEIVKRIRNELGCNILVSYGLSETAAPITIGDWDDDDRLRSETVGKAMHDVSIKLVDDLNENVAIGQVGEIITKGPGLMKGYYQKREETSKAIDHDGWFHTGDLGVFDESGYLRIIGRKKEMIIRGGYNIYPREIEEVLYTHPSVLEVAIVGLPDTVLGEISCAAIRLKTNDVTIEALKEFLGNHIADYKVPDKIVILEDIPMTASGKIKKIELQKLLEQQLQAELR